MRSVIFHKLLTIFDFYNKIYLFGGLMGLNNESMCLLVDIEYDVNNEKYVLEDKGKAFSSRVLAEYAKKYNYETIDVSLKSQKQLSELKMIKNTQGCIFFKKISFFNQFS